MDRLFDFAPVALSMQDIPTLVFENPALLGVLVVAVFVIVAWQRTLSYREYHTAHTAKTLLFRVADPWARKRGRPLINHKGDHTDPEFIERVGQSPREVLTALAANGFDYHLLSTDKRRANGGLDDGHAVYYHDDGRQTECYVFANADGTTDVYAHVETATTDPDGHLSDPQAAGDPRGVVRGTL